MDHKRTIGFELRIASNVIKRKVKNIIESHQRFDFNFTGIHCWIAGFIYSNSDKDIFQKDIEEEFSIRRSTATEILKIMEKNNLIMRIPVPYDARLKKLVLNKDVIEFYKVIQKEVDKIEEKIKEGITEEELKTFYSVLDRIKENINE